MATPTQHLSHTTVTLMPEIKQILPCSIINYLPLNDAFANIILIVAGDMNSEIGKSI